MTGPRCQAHVVAGTARQPQRLVLTDCASIDEAQGRDRWIEAAEPVEVVA